MRKSRRPSHRARNATTCSHPGISRSGSWGCCDTTSLKMMRTPMGSSPCGRTRLSVCSVIALSVRKPSSSSTTSLPQRLAAWEHTRQLLGFTSRLGRRRPGAHRAKCAVSGKWDAKILLLA
eukprot:Rmarinus@m.17617